MTPTKQLNPALARALAGNDPWSWARETAERLRDATAQRENCRLDLRPILKIRKIQGPERESDLGCTAALMPAEAGFRLVFNSDLLGRLKREQWRFTVAHEVGHTFFFDVERSPPARLSGLGFPEDGEERLCDLFAAELLMSQALVQEQYRRFRSEPFLTLLEQLAEDFGVSLAAMGIRLIADLSLWHGVLLCVRWSGKVRNESAGQMAWRILWSVSPQSSSHDIFIPKPTRYRPFLSSLKWRAVDEFVRKARPGVVGDLDFSDAKINRIGNLGRVARDAGCVPKVQAMVMGDRESMLPGMDDRQSWRSRSLLLSVDFSGGAGAPPEFGRAGGAANS